jgi:plasmid stabilization system protein ParE
MADVYRIHISKQAADQMREIFDYIARDAPQNAAKMIERLLDAVDSLDILPIATMC